MTTTPRINLVATLDFGWDGTLAQDSSGKPTRFSLGRLTHSLRHPQLVAIGHVFNNHVEKVIFGLSSFKPNRTLRDHFVRR